MKEMTDTQILEYTDNVCKTIVADSPSKRKKYCKNISHSPDRHCAASSHKDCRRCKWFTPTIMAKIRLLAEENAKLKEGTEKLAKQIVQLEDELELARATIELSKMKEGEADGQSADREELEGNPAGKKDDAGAISRKD